MKVLLTGIAGFYGHHLARYILENTDWEIVGLDRIDEAGNLNRLKDIGFTDNKRCKFIFHDLRSPLNTLLREQIGNIDIILHIAAASHVDRSVIDPMGYVLDNVVGTTNILEYARKTNISKFIYFSTDEVFGSVKENRFKEWDRFNPGNPYSASKAAGECMAIAYENTYKVPVIITHCMNIFGERQHPEKFLPKVIRQIRNNEQVTIHSDKSKTISGSRNYIYVDQVSAALMFILDKGVVGDKYNIEGPIEFSNLDLAKLVAESMGKELDYVMISPDNVRPGNDFSYGIDGSKLKEMGFSYNLDTIAKMRDVINWYLNNTGW